MLDFQRYQLAFTAHIRDPKSHPKPDKVPEKRLAVYRESVFNNIAESVSICFPVCQNVLGKRKWQRLLRQFVAIHSAESPLFKEIPQQFLTFLAKLDSSKQSDLALPPFIQQLAHYEWIELAISSKQTNQNATLQVASLDLNHVISLAAASELLAYDYPVHQISARFKTTTIEKTFFLVFRNSNFEVKFILLNPVTFRLLSFIQENQITGRQALTMLANELSHPDLTAFMQFGFEILEDLHQQQAVLIIRDNFLMGKAISTSTFNS